MAQCDKCLFAHGIHPQALSLLLGMPAGIFPKIGMYVSGVGGANSLNRQGIL